MQYLQKDVKVPKLFLSNVIETNIFQKLNTVPQQKVCPKLSPHVCLRLNFKQMKIPQNLNPAF